MKPVRPVFPGITRKTELPSAWATHFFPGRLRARTAPFALLWLSALLAPLSLPGQDVGSGPFSATIRNEFTRSYFRNNFHILTSLPPAGDVKRLGTTGLVQEFPDAAKTAGVRYALVRATSTDAVVAENDSVLHVYPNLYSYYSNLGANTVGYPGMDTRPCPVLVNAASCEWQTFDKKYVLFAYSQSTINGQNFNVKDPFYTKWVTLGGIGGLGPATNAEEQVVSTVVTGATATLQRFLGGALHNITAGNYLGRLFTVREPVYSVYQSNNGYQGLLGLPISDEIVQVNGRMRQNFEGGAIEYEPGQTPALRLPVASVAINTSIATDRLNLGDTAVLSAVTFAGNGGILEGRTITWVSSNSRVVTVDPSGTTVNIRAVGGGSASITGISEGKTSRPITFFVTAPCCQIGEGAPTAAAQQAFRDAVARNRLNVKLPAVSPVRRAGNGFVQELVSIDDPLTRYLVAKLDSAAVAYVATGAILERYNQLNGPAGAMGFPLGDPVAGPRQLFQGGALAGNPVFQVANPILIRWGLQNYERGPAGLPTGAAQTVLSFSATLGVRQSFTGGWMAGHLSGAFSERAFLVSGAILAKYVELGAASGAFGLPTGDESLANGRRRQEFEGGSFEVPAGAVEAIATEKDRKPQISATPATVPAGGRLRVAVGGFNTGATLRISVGGQPDFVVKTETGAFAWELLVAANAPTGLVTLRAVDTGRNAIAVGSYLVQSASSTLAQVTKVRGDLQTGYPGARLRQALRILVRDEFGNVLAGVPVRFTASPGARMEGASAVTDELGQAEAFLRLPLQELPALATAEAGRQVVTFSARTVSGSFAGFPRFLQGTSAETRDGLTNAAAAALRYLQDIGQVPASGGAAEPALLHRFLKDFCLFDPQGQKICDGFLVAPGGSSPVMNLWRLPAFTGGNVDIAPAGSKPDEIRDLLGQGVPVLLGLTLTTGGTGAASHFVVANGVSPNGAILIHDPSPVFNRTTLDQYLAGFTVSGGQYRGVLNSVVQMAPRSPSPVGMLVVTSEAAIQVSSAAGSCGFALSWPEAQAQPGSVAAAGLNIKMHYCDGILPPYQLDLGVAGRQSFILMDLGTTGGRSETTATAPAAFRLTRSISNWAVSLQQLSFAADSVRNGADFSTRLSPGVLASIFGQGLAVPGQPSSVEVGGLPATVISATSFQVNIAVPQDLTPGDHLVRIISAYGQAEQIVGFQPVSPALFRQAGQRGIVLNQDNTLNSPSNPARRGEVIVAYATGLGAVTRQGALDVAQSPVAALLDGSLLETLYAGLAPGIPGVYQLNLRIGPGLPPGLQQELAVRQGEIDSEAVFVAIQ